MLLLLPTSIKGEAYTISADIYSFGMCLIEICTLQPPWCDSGLG